MVKYYHNRITGLNTLLDFIYLFVSYWNLDSKYHHIKLMIATYRPQRIFGSRGSLKLDSKIIQFLLNEYKILDSSTFLEMYKNNWVIEIEKCIVLTRQPCVETLAFPCVSSLRILPDEFTANNTRPGLNRSLTDSADDPILLFVVLCYYGKIYYFYTLKFILR